jgi:hypothetical protein
LVFTAISTIAGSSVTGGWRRRNSGPR